MTLKLVPALALASYDCLLHFWSRSPGTGDASKRADTLARCRHAAADQMYGLVQRLQPLGA